jgi:hypothetical protein
MTQDHAHQDAEGAEQGTDQGPCQFAKDAHGGEFTTAPMDGQGPVR